MTLMFRLDPRRAETAGEMDELEGDVDRGPADADDDPDAAPGGTPDDAAGESGDPGAGPS